MYLVLGSPHDPCCARVHDAIARSGRRSTIIANPLVEPARFAWQIDDTGASGRWSRNGECAESVEGVLVRGGGWIDPDGWQPTDLAYAQAEMHAALVAWLRGLLEARDFPMAAFRRNLELVGDAVTRLRPDDADAIAALLASAIES